MKLVFHLSTANVFLVSHQKPGKVQCVRRQASNSIGETNDRMKIAPTKAEGEITNGDIMMNPSAMADNLF